MASHIRFLTALALILSCQSAQARNLILQAPVDIAFDTIVVGRPGTVTISSSTGLRSATGSVAIVGSGPVQRGSLLVRDDPGAQVLITVPSAIPMAGANSPTLDPIIEGGALQTIPANGRLTVYFGGTITFTTSGSYGPVSATVLVTVDEA